jgi:hypothetical protein
MGLNHMQQPPAERPGDKVHLFVVHLVPPARSPQHPRLRVDIGVDEYSSEATGSVSNENPRAHIDFLRQVLKATPYPIHQICTADDPMFRDREFNDACMLAGVSHIFTPRGPRVMRVQSWLERCVDAAYEIAPQALENINISRVLIDQAFQRVYNETPNCALDGKTPTQLRREFFENNS